MHEHEPAADHQPTVQVCTRCATNAKGFDVRVGTTGGYVATRYPIRTGRYCQPCARVIADEKNAQRRTRRQGVHGEVRHLVKDGKPVPPLPRLPASEA